MEVTGKTLGDAYQKQLQTYLQGEQQVTVVCDNPVQAVEDVDSYDVRDWDVNVGVELASIGDYEMDLHSDNADGSTIEDWVNDRIYALHDGFYAQRLQNPDKIEKIIDRLQHGMHGSSTNALVAQVYGTVDLERAVVARPNANRVACVTQLQFLPDHDRLHLYQTLRSQYVDLKGYGNLIAAATLLSRVCARTGYAPGSLVEHVHNQTSYRKSSAQEIHDRLIRPLAAD